MSGGGDDLPLAGTTAFDDDERTLADIQDRWLSADSYHDRLDSLGPLLLTGGSNPTVFGDDATDTLVGEGARDGYFAKLGAGVLDVVKADPNEKLFNLG